MHGICIFQFNVTQDVYITGTRQDLPILHLCADCINVVESASQYSRGRSRSRTWSNLHADLVELCHYKIKEVFVVVVVEAIYV